MSAGSRLAHLPRTARRRARLASAAYLRAERVWHQRIDRRFTLTLGGLLLTLGAGEMSQSWHLKAAFYVSVAQLVPILLLVGVVEGRYYRRLTVRTAFDRFLLRSVLLVPLTAEVAALACVGSGHDTTILRGLVLFGLGLSAMTLLIYAFHGPALSRVGATTEMLEAAERVRQLADLDAPSSAYTLPNTMPSCDLENPQSAGTGETSRPAVPGRCRSR